MEVAKYCEKKKKFNGLNVISFNANSVGQIKKEQIKQMKLINPDIFFLNEVSEEIIKCFDKYTVVVSCKTWIGRETIICFIKNEYDPIILENFYFDDKSFIDHKSYLEDLENSKIWDDHYEEEFGDAYGGMSYNYYGAISTISTNKGKIIVGTFHLPHRKEGSEKRKDIIKNMANFINDYDLPIILGGDANMRDFENNVISSNNFMDPFCNEKKYYLTWPNRNTNDEQSNDRTKKINNDFRFDRFLLRNVEYSSFKTINTRNSDHLMIGVNINIPQKNLFKLNYLEGKKVLIFDIETTGIPERRSFMNYFSPDQTDKYNSSRLVSIAWAYTNNFRLDKIHDTDIKHFIRKPKDFNKITNSNIHGITYEIAKEKGKKLSSIMNKYLSDILSECDYVIGHNVIFDINVLLSELYRIKFFGDYNDLKNLLDKKKYVCTMQLGKNICKIRKYNDYKYPSLDELYYYIFNKKFKNAHNAKGDVKAVIDIISS